MERTSDRSTRNRTQHPPRGGSGLLALLVGLGLTACVDEESSGQGGAGGTGGAGGSTTSSSTSSSSSGGSPTVFKNPPTCDAAGSCTLVPNEAGSSTRNVVLTAKGGTRELSVNGATTTFHVSTYNDSIPGPTIEVKSTASDPQNPKESDFLLIDVTNQGGLNLCCWQDCAPAPEKSCWPEYCQDQNLQKGDACVQVDGETNMHTHGLHIAGATTDGGAADACLFSTPDPASPDLPWDNIFITIPASGMAENMSCSPNIPMCMIANQQSFVYPLPPHASPSVFQPAATTYPHWFGLEWYHPHMHPTTSDQVQRGMAGALIIRNPAEDEIPVLAGLDKASEKILVLQSLASDDGSVTARLVSGLQSPRMTIRPGETQRFRVLNANSNAAVQLSFVSAASPDVLLPYYPIGFDGVPTPDIRPGLQTQYILPGSRLEFLLSAPADAAEGDTYDVTWCEPKFDASFNLVDTIEPDGQCTGTTVTAATLVVEGSAVTPTPFDPGDAFADLASFGLDPDLWSPDVQPAAYRTVTYSQSGSDFFLDTGEGPKQFSMDDMCNVSLPTTLGGVEQWEIVNETGDLHTFHLHVNPFQIDPSLVSPKLGAGVFYEDNILVPAGTGFDDPTNPNKASNPGVVTIRFKPVDYVGTSVFHCHVLFHEDHGMMATFTMSP